MMTKKGAFDPTRLDDELDELLPPVPLKLVPPPATSAVEAEPAVPRPVLKVQLVERDQRGVPTATAVAKAARAPRTKAPPSEQTKTVGGEIEAGSSVVVAAARLPQDLYEDLTAFLNAGTDRPSYAQLISWTCQDRPTAVIEDLTRSAAALVRVPRGRAKAAPFALVTPRFLPDEIVAVDVVQHRASTEMGQPVTRTQVICAAIRVAIRRDV